MTNKFSYSHGDTGDKPGSPLNFQSGDAIPPEHFDWWWENVITKVNSLADETSNLKDGTTKAKNADQLDGNDASAFLQKSTYDTNDNGTVDNAEQVDGYEATELLQASGLNLTSHELASGEFTALARVPSVPSNTTLRVETVSVANDAHNVPSGLNVVVRDATNGQNLATYNTGYASGTPHDTVNVGSIDLTLAVDNGNFTSGTGSTQVATCLLDASFR